MPGGRLLPVILDGTPFLHLPVTIWQMDPLLLRAEAMVGTELLACLPLFTYTLTHSTNRSELLAQLTSARDIVLSAWEKLTAGKEGDRLRATPTPI